MVMEVKVVLLNTAIYVYDDICITSTYKHGFPDIFSYSYGVTCSHIYLFTTWSRFTTSGAAVPQDMALGYLAKPRRAASDLGAGSVASGWWMPWEMQLLRLAKVDHGSITKS